MQMQPVISIIHPSRSRPELAAKTAKKWLSSAKYPEQIEYLFSVDVDDIKLVDYSHLNATLIALGYPTFLYSANNTSAISAINYAATKTSGNLIIVVSDDFDCPFHWDVALLEALEGKEDFIVKTDDGLQPWIITLPIMDRKYYERFGYVYPPHIKHMFADTWMTHVADLTARKIVLPIKFPHLHYTQPNGIKRDEVSNKNDSTWAQGEAAYLEGLRTNFGLKDEDIKGFLGCDQSHLNWLKSKGVNIELV